MQDWSVVVTTAPRREPTLAYCCASLEICGWEPILFAEPESQQLHYLTYQNSQRLGVWHNWLRACRFAVDQADRVLTVQDDSLFHPDSKSFIESFDWPSDVGFISLYTPKHYSLLRQTGIYVVNTRSLWGACALAWNSDVLRKVIEHPIAKNWLGASPRSRKKSVIESRRLNPHLIQNSDTAIGKILNALGLKMYFIDPSPVQHIAVYSATNHGGNKGRRNCLRCADHKLPLEEQVYASFVSDT